MEYCGGICRVCENPTSKLWTGRLLNFEVDYFECTSCGYVQTENPYWIEDAYADAINKSDTGILSRNISNGDVVLVTLLALGKLGDTVVDFAGGYGTLVRLLRDYGVDAFWYDPYCQNLFARGFEYNDNHFLNVSLVTAFEAFEHFVRPDEELGKMLEVSPNVLFSTDIIPDPTPRQDDWWYYGRDHGQHVGFFRIKTLKFLASKHNKILITDNSSYHLICEKNMNEILWRMLFLGKRIIAPILKLKLESKTWKDHLRLKEK